MSAGISEVGLCRTSLRGRQAELRLLDQSIASTVAGRSHVVMVQGSAGLGKSRMLAAAAGVARRQGMDVAAGQAEELDRFSPLTPLLTDLHRGRTLTDDAGTLATTSALPLDHAHLIDELTEAIQDRARHRPVLVSLDDLHRVDEPTLLGIQAVIRRLSGSPVMWLMSRRLKPSSAMLHGVLADLTAGGATTVELEPLTPDGVRELGTGLLGRAPDDALLALLAKCSGNPLLVTELLRSMAERDELVVDTTDARLLPAGPRGHLYERLSTGMAVLSPPTREFVEVASTFGTSFDVNCVAWMLHRTVAELLPAVHEALDNEWLAEEGDQLCFRHRVVREAVYAAVPLSARRALHREAAAALLAIGGCAAEVTAHLLTGAEAGNADGVRLIVQASDQVAPGAPGTAADLLLRAVDLMPSDDLRRHRRTEEAIEMLLRAGRAREAVALGEAALEASLPTDIEARLRSCVAEALGVGGRPGDALRQTRIGLDLPIVDTSTRAQLLAVESTAQLLEGDVLAALRAAEEALRVADATRSGDGLTRVASVKQRALASMGAAERMRGRLGTSLQLIDRAVLTAPADARELETSWSRGRTLIALDRIDEASATFAAATHQAEQSGRTASTVSGHTCLAALRLYQGALDAAVTEGSVGLSRAESVDSEADVPELSAILAEASACSGLLGPARQQVRRGLAAEGRGGPFALAALAWASTTIADVAGEKPARILDHARDLYETAPGRIELLAVNPMVGPRLVSIALAAGDRPLAAVATELVESLDKANPGVTSLAAAALQARGLLDGDADRLVAAERSFRSSARLLARAWAAEDVARALRREQRFPAAVDHFTSALADYDRAGAVHHVQRMRHQLSTMRVPGGPVATRRSCGWDALTTAELRVVRMVADGLTNRMIADRLSLSPHTVESHLRHSFHKLDIRSRVELTRIVVEHESSTNP